MKRYLPSLFWALALLALFLMREGGPSLCLFRALGFAGCPGCGLGHSIHHALHGRWPAAWNEHPLGIPAVFILFYEIVKPFLTASQYRHNDRTANAPYAPRPAAR